MKKNNLKRVGGLLLILLVLSTGCNKKENEVITYDKEEKDYVEKQSNINEEQVDEKVEEDVSNNNVNTESNKNESDNNVQVITVRTYRFFGYTEDFGPDMYTTLKLYSNSEYELFVNNCHGVTRFSGTYKETDKDFTLTGQMNMIFIKANDGSLKFDATKLDACNDPTGSFVLESVVLGSKNVEDTKTQTYRFFGYTEDFGPDMYTTLKLYSNSEYELFVNNCHGVTRFSGNYKLTDKEIILTGEKNMTFTKNSDGSLKFDATKLDACTEITGRFSLESKILANK